MERNKLFLSAICLMLAFAFVARRATDALAVTSASAAQQSSAPVHFTAGGNATEIPAKFLDNLVFLPVHVNDGKPSLFELDSTAQVSSIDPGRAAEVSLTTPAPAAPSAQVEAATAAPTIRNPVIALPGVDVPLASIALFAPRDFGEIVGQPYEGTLGTDFLNRVVVEVDYGRETVRLYDANSYHYEGKGTIVPLTLAGGLPLIHAKFTEPRGKSLAADFVVNTALDDSIVFSTRFAEAHHLFSTRMSTVSASDPELDGGANVPLARMKSFHIGSYEVEDALVAYPQSEVVPAGNAQIAGAIGGGLLRRYVVVFDFPHQQMMFTPSSVFRLFDQEDKSGLTIVAKGADLKRFEVEQVQQGSPASAVGIQKGDVIAGIDNEAAADMTLASVRELFRQIPHTYKLLIERDGKTMDVTIVMHRRI